MLARMKYAAFDVIMESSVMDFHDFGRCSLIFTMFTGEYSYQCCSYTDLFMIATRVINNCQTPSARAKLGVDFTFT